MRCLDENVVVDLLQGTLPREMRGAVEEHLDECAECRSMLADAAKAWRDAGDEASPSEQRTRSDDPVQPSTRRDSQQTTPLHGEASADGAPDGAPTASVSQPGVMIDHFRIKKLLGRGGMGEVYLARDTQLGRQVALKLVLPEFLGSDEAIKQFKREARTTARFSHPHIVTIHAVGDFEGKPYVALEYLQGHDLRERLRDRPLSLPEVYRVGLAIAQALTEAHGAGVLHRDLKPENVVIPQDGRVRVVDFGLAKRVPIDESLAADADHPLRDELPPSSMLDDRDKSTAVGTPAYMAPEQWLAQGTTSATDVWSLGVMLFELCAGRRPFEGPDVDDPILAVIGPDAAPSLKQFAPVPADFARLIGECLDKNPKRRPTARKVAVALGPLLYPDRVTWGGSQSPFRGLLPFTERQAAMFFGREPEIAALCERLRREPVLPVVGPSGAGKSSLVRAGVIPRLKEQQLWTVIQLRPSARPMVVLAARLAQQQGAADPPAADKKRAGDDAAEPPSAREAEADLTARIDKLAARLIESPTSLALELRAIAERTKSQVLLFVDQLEELYTLCDDELERRHFMQAICAAADDANEPVRVVFTLRDDFLGRVSSGPEVQQALNHLAVLQRPGDAELEEILQAPPDALGYAYDDPQLVDEMIAAVRGEAACLPLLQFTAQMLWAHRDKRNRRLLRAEYERLGGVEGALARHADGVLERFTLPEREHARALLLRLVTPERTRKVVARDQALDGLAGEAEEVLDRLTEARLVSVRRSGGSSDQAQLELVHESLIDGWGTLSRWLDEAREQLAFVAEVEQAAALWEKRGQRSEQLWRGDALSDALRSARRCSEDVGQLARAFLEASRSEERRRMRRRRVGIAAAFVVMVAALTVAVLMIVRVRQDEQSARATTMSAQRDRAAALLESAQADYEQGRPLEARIKLRTAFEVSDSTAARALFWLLSEESLLWQRELNNTGCRVRFSRSGRAVAVGCGDGSVYLVDTRTTHTRGLRGHDAAAVRVTFSDDGRLLEVVHADGQARKWDVATAKLSAKLERAADAAEDALVSPDGKLRATLEANGSVRLWDESTNLELAEFAAGGDAVASVSFSDSGAQLATVSESGSLRLWDVKTAIARPPMPSDQPATAETPTTGKGEFRLVVTGGVVRVVDRAASERARFDTGLGVTAAALAGESPTGPLIVGFRDGSVERWRRGKPKARPSRKLFARTPAGVPTKIVAGPQDTAIVAYDSGFVGMWSHGDGARLAATTLSGSVTQLSFDGKLLEAKSEQGELIAWDLSAFNRPYCELLTDLWQQVPMVWENGHAAGREPPPGHRCAP